MNLKKWVGAGLSSLMLISVVTACSSKGNTDPSNASSDSSSKKLELTFSTNTPEQEESKKVWDEIAAGYMKKNPDVKIKLDYAPKLAAGPTLRTWITTGLVGGTTPDVFPTRLEWTHEDLRKDLLLDLTSYYDQPNPYNGNKKWEETFKPSVMESFADPSSGKYAGVPTSTFLIRVLYNRDMFKKYGLEVPKTWTEFIDVQKKLKDNHVVPFAMANSKPTDNHYQWAVTLLTNQIFAEKVKSFDQNNNKRLSNNEVVAAVDQNAINMEAPEWNAVYPIIKDWSQYWAKGFNSLNYDSAIDMFLRGDAAMTFAISNSLPIINGSSARKFEYGGFALPYLTKNQDANASEKVYELGGYPVSVYAIPKNIKEDKKKAAIDFLMYLSSPDVAVMMGEKMSLPTTLKDIKEPENMSAFQFAGEMIPINIYAPVFDTKLNEDLTLFGQLYLEGSIKFEEYTNKLQKDLKTAIDNYMKNNGWNKDNSYGGKK